MNNNVDMQKMSNTDRESDAGKQCSLDKNDTLNHRISLTNLLPFCNQLEKFIKYIKSIKDLNYLTYEYPNDLQNRLDTNVCELQSILAEVKHTLINIEQLRMQRKLIKKEKVTIKRTLREIRDNEIRDMECTISLYDKTMFSRWENVKDTHKPEVLLGMLSDIKGKQLALENLNTLVINKLNQLQAFSPLIGNDTGKLFAKKLKTAIPLPFSSFTTLPNTELRKVLLPPTPQTPSPLPVSYLPLPIPPQIPLTSHLTKRSHAQRLSIQRRRRREENIKRCTNITNIDNHELFPLTLNDIPQNLVSNVYPITTNINRCSNHDIISANSTSSILIGNGLSDIFSISNNNGSNNGLESEFQNEIRTVLQALFGDLRTAFIITDSSSNETTESIRNTNKEIELYTLHKLQQ